MAYAELADVLARAGRLAGSWDAQTTPGEPDIERMLDDVAAEIDALIASRGFSTPITTDPSLTALRRLNAVGALAAVLVATYPNNEGAGAAAALRDRMQKEYDDGMAAIVDGTHPAIAVLEASAGAPGASDFWTANPDYRVGLTAQDVLSLNPYLQPEFEKGDPF